ncbi:MAG TPA: tetratricopeptide repeat protein, partial [Tepidisphaeraceae bacterium]|nr:tetratricopeptide repeat protein [Tepidisphaeraceae bacterium]
IQCSYASNRLTLARSYIEQGRHLFPNNVLLREMELQHELAHGDPEKVIAPRQEQLNKTPDNKRAWALLGNAYLAVARHKAGDPAAKQFLDKARDTFAQALAKWPDDISFVKAIADVAVQSKNYADGEKAIRDLQAQPQWQNKPEPTLLLADLYVQSGKPADAEKVLRSYLSANPTAIPVQLKLATVLSQAGKAEEAMKVLSESNASDPQVHKSRIELLIINKRLDEALKESNAALAGNPNPSPALLTQHAFVLMSLGRTSEALEILDRVLASNPDNVEALFYRGSLFVSARRNLDQAVRDLQTVREAMSDNVEARLYLADAYVFKDDLEAAIAELEAAVRQLPDARQPKIRLLELYAQSEPPRWRDADRVLKDARQNPRLANDIELLNAEALMWLKRKDVNKAGEVITTALKQSPNNLNLFRTYCEVLHQAKQHRELLRVTDGPVKSKQAPWWFYVYRGRALKALDDKQAALDEFSAGLEAAGADEDAATRIVQAIAEEIGVAPAKIRIASRAQKGENRWRMMMAYLCQIEPDIQQAINWTEQVINDSKSTPQEIEAAQRMLGPLYLRLDPPEVTKAVAVFQKMLERRPDDPAALNNLACTMILPNSGYTPQDALVYSQKAYDIMERAGRVEPMIHDTHGYVLVLNGRVEEGLHLLQQALEKQAFPEGYYHLGEAYLAMKVPMTTDAEQAFNQAKTLLDRAARDNQPVDLALKQKVEQALERLRQPGQAGAAQGQESAGAGAAASPDAPGSASR